MSKKSKNKSDNKPRVKYHSFDTFPAKVFFDIAESKNYQLMRPKPGLKAAELERIYNSVDDEYFIKLDNEDAKRYIELRNNIAFMMFKQATIESIMKFVSTAYYLFDNPEVEEMRTKQIEALNEHLEEPIDLDIEFPDEVLRVMNVEIGIIKDDIQMALDEIDDMKTRNMEAVFNYYEEVTALEDIHGRTLDERMMLPKFVEYVKLAQKKNKQAILKQASNGK